MRESSLFVPVHAGLARHHKVGALARCLGVSRVTSLGHLVTLWISAVGQFDDGCIDDWHPDDIAHECQWTGDPALFLAALVDSGWVDMGDDGGMVLHGWEDYAGKALDRRAQAAKSRTQARDRKAKQRAKARKDKGHNGCHDEVTRDSHGAVSPSRALELELELEREQERETRADAPASQPPLSSPASPPDSDPGADGFENQYGSMGAKPVALDWLPPTDDAAGAWDAWVSALVRIRNAAWTIRGMLPLLERTAARQLSADANRIGEALGWDVFAEACGKHISSGRGFGGKDPSKSLNYLRGIAEGIIGDRAGQEVAASTPSAPIVTRQCGPKPKTGKSVISTFDNTTDPMTAMAFDWSLREWCEARAAAGLESPTVTDEQMEQARQLGMADWTREALS